MNGEYVPRYFEQESSPMFPSCPTLSTLEIILKADPSASKKRFKGRTPVHLAIASGKNFEEISHLLKDDDFQQQDNHYELACRDPQTFLYPFQLAATYPNKGDGDSFRWTCVARNKFSHAVWQGKSDREKASEILKVAEGEELCRIDTIFRLLRRVPGVVRPGKHEVQTMLSVKGKSKGKAPMGIGEERELIESSNIGILPYLKDKTANDSRQSKDSSSTSDDSSFLEASKLPMSPSNKATPTSLTLLLSKGRKMSKRSEEFFDCDASVLSNVDVLSTLTSTLHTNKTSKAKETSNEDEQSISILSEDAEDESDSDDGSSFDGFAEDSGLRSLSEGDELYGDGKSSPKQSNFDSNTTETSSIESSVCFEVRKRPRKLARGVSDLKQSSRDNFTRETPSLRRAAYLQTDKGKEDVLEDTHHTETADLPSETDKDESSISVAEDIRASQVSANPINERKSEKIEREQTLLGSFTAGSESEGLAFDVADGFPVSPPPLKTTVLYANTGSPTIMQGKESKVHSKTFDKAQMKWIKRTPEIAYKMQTSKLDPFLKNPEKRNRHQQNPFDCRPPRFQKSSLLAKKVSSRNLNSCMLCDHGALEVLLIPCKHLCICRRCSKTRASIQQCPVCSSAVTDRMILLG